MITCDRLILLFMAYVCGKACCELPYEVTRCYFWGRRGCSVSTAGQFQSHFPSLTICWVAWSRCQKELFVCPSFSRRSPLQLTAQTLPKARLLNIFGRFSVLTYCLISILEILKIRCQQLVQQLWETVKNGR